MFGTRHEITTAQGATAFADALTCVDTGDVSGRLDARALLAIDPRVVSVSPERIGQCERFDDARDPAWAPDAAQAPVALPRVTYAKYDSIAPAVGGLLAEPWREPVVSDVTVDRACTTPSPPSQCVSHATREPSLSPAVMAGVKQVFEPAVVVRADSAPLASAHDFFTVGAVVTAGFAECRFDQTPSVRAACRAYPGAEGWSYWLVDHLIELRTSIDRASLLAWLATVALVSDFRAQSTLDSLVSRLVVRLRSWRNAFFLCSGRQVADHLLSHRVAEALYFGLFGAVLSTGLCPTPR